MTNAVEQRHSRTLSFLCYVSVLVGLFCCLQSKIHVLDAALTNQHVLYWVTDFLPSLHLKLSNRNLSQMTNLRANQLRCAVTCRT